jgi:hypothetical protein
MGHRDREANAGGSTVIRLALCAAPYAGHVTTTALAKAAHDVTYGDVRP